MDVISDVSRGSEIDSSVPARLPLPDPLDLDELFGFNEALQKRKNNYGVVCEVKRFDNNKVFINTVDSFCGKFLVQVLTRKEKVIEPQELVIEGHVDESHTKIKKSSKKSDSPKGVKDLIEKVNKDKGSKSTKSPKDVKSKTKKKKSSVKQVEDVICKNIESIHDFVEDENDIYDTSRLTVAEYYEWLELAPGSDRDDFLKEKLGKYVEEQKSEFNLPKGNESLEDKAAITNRLDIKHFIVTGTLQKNNKCEGCVPEGVSEILNMSANDEAFYEQISKCGFIIYFINEDYKQAVDALSVFNSLLNYFDENPELTQTGRPLFILVSSFMTWALTKPLDPNDLELPYTEKDYRKRIPHPNYQLHYELEQQIIKAKNKNKIDSIILTCGIPYGHEENVLSNFFETAYNYKDLQIYCSGNNILPIVHVENMALYIKEVIQKKNEINLPFLFINDKFIYSLKDLVKGISTGLGTGCYKVMPEAFAFLNDDLSQDIYDQTTVNISFQSCYPLLDENDVKYKDGFVNNIKFLIDEFIKARNKIKPKCFILYGAENLNMTSLPVLLSKYYNVPNLLIENVINQYIENVVDKLQEANIDRDIHMETNKQLEMVDNNVDGDNNEGKRVCVDILNSDKQVDIGKNVNTKEFKDMRKLSDTQKIYILKEKLKETLYLYHGYVLNEFPSTLHEAEIFFSLDERKNLEEGKIPPTCRFPDYVVYLHESQDILVENIHSLDIQVLNNNIESVANVPDETSEILPGFKIDEIIDIKKIQIINCFLGRGSNLIVIHSTRNDDQENVLKLILRKIEEIEEATHRPDVYQECAKGVLSTNISPKDIHARNMPNTEIQNELFKRLKEEEEMILSMKSYPLLNYLINFIYPTLTNALLKVAGHRPEDPLDFLSECLFKENPHGRMIDPKQLISKDADKDLGFPNIDSKTCLA